VPTLMGKTTKEKMKRMSAGKILSQQKSAKGTKRPEGGGEGQVGVPLQGNSVPAEFSRINKTSEEVVWQTIRLSSTRSLRKKKIGETRELTPKKECAKGGGRIETGGQLFKSLVSRQIKGARRQKVKFKKFTNPVEKRGGK